MPRVLPSLGLAETIEFGQAALPMQITDNRCPHRHSRGCPPSKFHRCEALAPPRPSAKMIFSAGATLSRKDFGTRRT